MSVLTNCQIQTLAGCDLHIAAAVNESDYPEQHYDDAILVQGEDPRSGQYVFVKRGCYVWLNLFQPPFYFGEFDLSSDLGEGYKVYSERKYYEKWPEALGDGQ